MKLKNISICVGLFIIIILLSGCLAPQGSTASNQIANEEQIQTIQKAVENFSEETNGLLPIVTKEGDTPIFEKYLLDFNKLQEYNLIGDLPSNAFEKGGVYQYTLINAENNPEVKVIDLRTTDQLQSVYNKLDIYRSKNIYPPYGSQLEDGVFEIDYEKIGLDNPPYVVSPFSNENLPIIMDIHGKLFIDYSSDLYTALESHEHNYEDGDDIRYLLTDHYPFAPAFSLPYILENGKPVMKLN